jgi:hypothetical protein
MKLNRIEAEVLAYLQASAGQRFEVGQIAANFKVSIRSMRTTLHSLESKERIHSAHPSRQAVQWYAEGRKDGPVVEPREVFKRGQEYKPDPIFLSRVYDSLAHRAAYPSRFN